MKAKLESATRLYKLTVPLVGLTGGIASGKSTVSKMLRAQGIPVIDADHLVKEVYSLPETIEYIQRMHPEAWKNGAIHFPTLREKFFNHPSVKMEIENFIYARLPAAFERAFKQFLNPEFVVYDVPLLYEKRLEKLFDLTVLVYAPRKVQRARLMDRDGHMEDMADQILNSQMDIEDKKLKADFVLDNSGSIEGLKIDLEKLVTLLRSQQS